MNIGKAYSGLTDVEIAEMTKWFLEHTIEDQGFRRVVEPKIVLEVAFNNMMRPTGTRAAMRCAFRGSCVCVRINRRKTPTRWSGPKRFTKIRGKLMRALRLQCVHAAHGGAA